MNSLIIFTLFVVFTCFAPNSCALPIDNMELPVKAAGSAISKDVIVAVPLTKLIDAERSNVDDSSNKQLKRTARGLGLGFGGKFGSFGGLGQGLKGFSGGFGGLGGLGGGGHGLGGGLGLLKFKPFFNKFG